jgi:hypothetical protein
MSEHEQHEQAASARFRLALLRRRERFERERTAWRPPATPMHMARHRRGRQ